MPRIFVSHSSKDRELAGLLVDLLRSALSISAESIRCTSVEGHRLRGGQETDQALKVEIRVCEAFIGLISAASIESAYVLFELGARWGAEKHLLPLLAPDADPSLLHGPLSGTNALSCSNAADLHQMVHELGELLDLVPEKPQAYQRRLDEILGLAARSTVIRNTVAGQAKMILPEEVNLPNESGDYAGAEETLQKHCAQKWPDDFSMRAYCIEQQRAALSELKMGRPADVPEEIFQRIRQKCAAKWPDDYMMRQYCEEEQVKSYRKIQAG